MFCEPNIARVQQSLSHIWSISTELKQLEIIGSKTRADWCIFNIDWDVSCALPCPCAPHLGKCKLLDASLLTAEDYQAKFISSSNSDTVTLWQWYPVNNLQTDLSWRLASKLAKNIELVSISAGRLMYISHLLYLFLKIMIWHLDFGSCCSAYCTLVRKLWNWTTRNIRLRAETGKD